MENNARCPNCNGEYFVDFSGKQSVCPYCGTEFDTIRVRKYFSAFHGKAGINREVHGSDYFKYDEYLRIGSHHLERDEFAEAKTAYASAAELNPGDYRGYMGLVAVETRNYTDLKNTTHKQFLNRALSVATEEQKKYIAESYRVYNAKASMSDDEYAEYLGEKQKDFKSRIKKAILGFARVNESKQKKAKTCIVFACVSAAVGLISLVLGSVLLNLLLLFLCVVCNIVAYALFLVWSKQRYNERLYAFLVEMFNAIKGFNLDYDKTDKVLEYMAALLLSVKNGDPHINTDKIVDELADYLISTGSREAKTFLRLQKLTAKYVGND